MEIISESSLTAALCTCRDNPRYKINILFSSTSVARAVIADFIKLSRDPGIDQIREITETPNGGKIQFINGSAIELMSQYDADGIYACHDLLWDFEIDSELLPENIEFMKSRLVKYHGKEVPTPKDWTDGAETAEIDEFLASFSIRK